MAVGLKLKYAFRHAIKRNPLVLRWCEGLVARERSAPAEHLARQRARLRRLFESARDTPAYARLAVPPAGADTLEYLRDAFPVIDKSHVLRNQADFMRNGRVPAHRVTVAETSGTTGTPLDVYRSVNSMLVEEAFHLQHWRWAGWRPGSPQAVLRGEKIVPLTRQCPPFWETDPVGGQLLLSTRHLSRDTAPMFVRQMRSSGATQLRAYPSAAHNLAVYAEDAGLELRLESVITGSEMLYDFQRERIERVFGCRVFDFYGMAERVAFAAECERGRLHVNPEYGVVEILDARGLPTDGEGSIVGTSLLNTAMPLIRYRMHDSARWDPRPCPCGRTYPVIEKMHGRLADQLYDLDGRAVNCTMIGFAFDGVRNIRKAQVAQTSADQWVIRIVPAQGYSWTDGEGVLARLAARVSARVRARIELHEDIPALPSGKYRWVVQEFAR